MLIFKKAKILECIAIIELAKNEQLSLSKNIELFAVKKNNEIIAISGIVHTGKTAVLKFAFVKPNYRNKGILSYMIDKRIEILKSRGVKKINVNCMPMSIGSHLRKGARIIKNYKYGGAKVIYENF